MTASSDRSDGSCHEPVVAAGEPVAIDCDSCTMRHIACGDCVVSVLLGAPPSWNAEEQRALGVLADSGLVPPLRLVSTRSAAGADTSDTPVGTPRHRPGGGGGYRQRPGAAAG